MPSTVLTPSSIFCETSLSTSKGERPRSRAAVRRTILESQFPNDGKTTLTVTQLLDVPNCLSFTDQHR